MDLKHIESLIDGNGDITIGSFGPIGGAAVDDDQPPEVVTAYRTSKVEKYCKEPA